MTIRARVLFHSAALLALVAGPFIPASSAGLLASVAYTGTIGTDTNNTNITDTVTINGISYSVLGDAVSGTFTYGAPASGSNPNSTGTYTLSSLSPAPTFTFTITGIAAGNSTMPLNFTDKYVANSTAYQGQVTWTSSTNTTLSLTGPMANTNVLFDLYLANTTGGGGYSTKNLTLPGTSTITSDFNPSASNLLFDFIGFNSEDFYIPQLSTLVALPEPSSLVIVSLTSAIGAVGYSVSKWRKRRIASGASIA